MLTKWVRRAKVAAMAVAAVLMILWGVIVISFSDLSAGGRGLVALLSVVSIIAIASLVRPFGRQMVAYMFVFAVLTIWWVTIRPSNDREWQPDVAILPSARIEGDQILVRNIRNFRYRTETDYEPQYYDKTFDLNKLRTVDLFLVNWGLPVDHTIVSFGFSDGTYLPISIEARKERGEDYSAFKGFFKQYELIYIVADERDVVGLRTNFRSDENVYLYRINAEPELLSKVLIDYLRTVNSLEHQPEWYNALTKNCTTSIRGHYDPYTSSRWHWQFLLNGYLDRLLYDKGRLDRTLSFDELKKISFINERAKAGPIDTNFSERIRTGLPGMNSPK